MFWDFVRDSTMSFAASIFLNSIKADPFSYTALDIIWAAIELPSDSMILANFSYSFCITMYLYFSASYWATCFFSIESINSGENFKSKIDTSSNTK